MAYRRYTKKEKAAAVLAAANSTVTAAAEQTGIARKTIAYWIEQPEWAELRRKTDAERADGFRLLSIAAMNRLAELVPTMDAKDLIVLMGVATDKGQLLAGAATSRSESLNVTDGMDDHERAALKLAVKDALAKAGP